MALQLLAPANSDSQVKAVTELNFGDSLFKPLLTKTAIREDGRSLKI
jgi:hypothetical protein